MVKKMWKKYTMEYYSAIKKNDIMFARKWIEPKIIMLSEVSQSQKDKCHMFSLICGIKMKEKKEGNSFCKASITLIPNT
jgi:hypothetical protein